MGFQVPRSGFPFSKAEARRTWPPLGAEGFGLWRTLVLLTVLPQALFFSMEMTTKGSTSHVGATHICCGSGQVWIPDQVAFGDHGGPFGATVRECDKKLSGLGEGLRFLNGTGSGQRLSPIS